MNKLGCIVLCAGQSSRMNALQSKMLYEVCGKPLCMWSIDLAIALKVESIVAVLGFQWKKVSSIIPLGIKRVIQKKRMGTGHAVQIAFDEFIGFNGKIIILYGDTPLVKFETIKKLIKISSNSSVGIITAKLINPFGYGRVVRDGSGMIKKISEECDATDDVLKINEINSGIYVFDSNFLEKHLFSLSAANNKSEYYLTDLIEMAGDSVVSIEVPEEEIFGVNDFSQMANVDRILRKQIINNWMRKGVQIIDCDTVHIDSRVTLNPGVILEPGVILKGLCVIGPGTRIGAYSVLQDSIVGKNCQIGPFAHLKHGTVIGENCCIGNFVEIKNSYFKQNSKAKHFAYIGDTRIGSFCNIGAGTVVCNYDGVNKYKTVIDDNAFIGSNSSIIAPVHIFDGAYVAAGSVITKDIPKNCLGISRVNQENKSGRNLPRNKAV